MARDCLPLPTSRCPASGATKCTSTGGGAPWWWCLSGGQQAAGNNPFSSPCRGSQFLLIAEITPNTSLVVEIQQMSENPTQSRLFKWEHYASIA